MRQGLKIESPKLTGLGVGYTFGALFLLFGSFSKGEAEGIAWGLGSSEVWFHMTDDPKVFEAAHRVYQDAAKAKTV